MLLMAVPLRPVLGQTGIKGIVADSASRQVLPFATVRANGGNKTAITEMNGSFRLPLPSGAAAITVSYTGYRSQTWGTDRFRNGDTVWLARLGNTLAEVVIRPDADKVRRILNKAIRNKPLNNPEFYAEYRCNMYYKMYGDPLLPDRPKDTAARPKKTDTALSKKGRERPALNWKTSNMYLVFSEAYSRRSYRKPQLQELILASRFSGLKKTYFSNLVTNVLPFHVYADYITINGSEYLSPLTKGWQQRYAFRLEDEVVEGNDTTFVLSYRPKNKGIFEGLEGMVYISTRGYAISHFSGSHTSLSTGREMKFDQQYQWVDGRWFPAEMNYRLSFKRMRPEMPGFVLNGHAVVSDVAFAYDPGLVADKAYPVKLADSIDLRSESYWAGLRSEPLAKREGNTYRIIDSLFKKRKVEKLMASMGSLPLGRFALGPVDVDPARIAAFNTYEGTRLGLGLYTNDRVSPYFSVGAWAGYGFKDKVWKYGGSATFYPKANKDNWLRVYQNDGYQNAGLVNLHPEMGQAALQNWLLLQPDRIKEYGAMGHLQKGYWQVELGAKRQNITNLYNSGFAWQGKSIRQFTAQEATLGLRHAYGEKRVPVFGHYMPDNSVPLRYPVLYASFTVGRASAQGYATDYARLLAGLVYERHTKRWGRDEWRLMAGGIATRGGNSALPRSFLMAGNGLRRSGGNFYLPGGYMTMFQNEFYGNRFVSLYYLHSFDKYLWKNKYSQPFVSIAHNLLYSGMNSANKQANPDIKAAVSGYHETGLVLNQLVQFGLFNLFTVHVNTGLYAHWTPGFEWGQHTVWVTGIGARF
jgi:hypothetical protein